MKISNSDRALESNNEAWFRVQSIFWNVGVNHEATLACSLGDISLEETVNKTALTHFQQFISKFLTNLPQQNTTQFEDILSTDTTIETTTKEQYNVQNKDNCSINSALIQKMLSDLKKTVIFLFKICNYV